MPHGIAGAGDGRIARLPPTAKQCPPGWGQPDRKRSAGQAVRLARAVDLPLAGDAYGQVILPSVAGVAAAPTDTLQLFTAPTIEALSTWIEYPAGVTLLKATVLPVDRL